MNIFPYDKLDLGSPILQHVSAGPIEIMGLAEIARLVKEGTICLESPVPCTAEGELSWATAELLKSRAYATSFFYGPSELHVGDKVIAPKDGQPIFTVLTVTAVKVISEPTILSQEEVARQMAEEEHPWIDEDVEGF